MPSRRWITNAELLIGIEAGRTYIETEAVGKVSLAGAAEASGISQYHFHRLYRHAYGETPHRAIARRKLDVAKKLLESTGEPVWRIALELGFRATPCFCRFFRAAAGQTPSDWRGAQKRGFPTATRRFPR